MLYYYYHTASALRLGALHLFATVVLMFAGGRLGENAVWVGTWIREPAQTIWVVGELHKLGSYMQWPVLVINSMFWGFIVYGIWRRIYDRWFVWRFRRRHNQNPPI